MFDRLMCPTGTKIWEKTSAQLLSLAFSVLVARGLYRDVMIKRQNTVLLLEELFKESLDASKYSEHLPDRGKMYNVWVGHRPQRQKTS